jgi:hypothetical protein
VTTCKRGDRIRLINMPNDPDPIPPGTTGTVLELTEGLMAQITVAWDNRRSLVLIPGTDLFEVIGYSDLVAECLGCPECHNMSMDLLDWDDDYERVTCAICRTTYTP